MNDVSKELADATDRARHEVAETVRRLRRFQGSTHRRVFAAGRVPPGEERRLRKRAEEARAMSDTYGGHGYEIEAVRAEEALETFLLGRAERLGSEGP